MATDLVISEGWYWFLLVAVTSKAAEQSFGLNLENFFFFLLNKFDFIFLFSFMGFVRRWKVGLKKKKMWKMLTEMPKT